MKLYMIEVDNMQMCMKKNLCFPNAFKGDNWTFVFSHDTLHTDPVSATPPKSPHGF